MRDKASIYVDVNTMDILDKEMVPGRKSRDVRHGWTTSQGCQAYSYTNRHGEIQRRQKGNTYSIANHFITTSMASIVTRDSPKNK